jgi:sugar phosphate isomerase/epimerase
MDDPVQMRATLAALADTGMRVHDIEFVRITPELGPASLAPLLDTGAALGARHLICAPYDPDLSRLTDRLADLATRAAPYGIAPVLEFFPWTNVPDLTTCARVTAAAGVGMLVDALHFDRSGSRLADLAAIAPDRLPFAHLCDAPVAPPYTTEALLHAARADRLAPGVGQIDLPGFLRALPADLPLALEIPTLAPVPDPATRLAALRAATLTLLDSIA